MDSAKDMILDRQRQFYRDLAAAGYSALAHASVEVAPYINDLGQDHRLGLSLIIRPRPSLDVSLSLEGFTKCLRNTSLFVYDRFRFHFTVLSLATPSDSFDLHRIPVGEYIDVIRSTLARVPPISLEIIGICPTSNAIIACGYQSDDILENARNALRVALTDAGLGKTIDQRHRITGAHLVVARFTASCDIAAVQTAVAQLGAANAGAMRVEKSHLVVNDQYMSPDKVSVLAEFSHVDSPQPPELGPERP